MNWTPTPIVRSACVLAGVGMSVQDETGCRWMTVSCGGPMRCSWCHHEFRTGWHGDRFHGSPNVCSMHVVVDWSLPPLERDPFLPAYMGPGDERHQGARGEGVGAS